MKLLKNSTVVAISSALAMGMSGVATAGDVNMSGWVFQTIVDRDSADDLEFTPLGNSLNQITFDASQDIGNGLTAGVTFRLASFTSDQSAANNDVVDEQNIRVSGGFGTVELGQYHSASFVADSYDGTPTYWVDPMGWLNVFGAGGLASFAPVWAGVGASLREERIRYVSPNFSGVTIRLDVGDNDSSEAAILYSGNGIIANAFTRDDGGTTETATGFMLAYNSTFGLFGSFVSVTQDQTGGSGENEIVGFKIGYGVGKHAVSVSQHTFDDGSADDYERSALTYVYQPTGTFQLYAQSVSEELGTQDDDAIGLGAGIFF